jgi:CHAT domain-containing protein
MPPSEIQINKKLPCAALLLAAIAVSLHAQSPFQFREAYLLERRMEPDRGGFVDISHLEENLNRVIPTAVQNGDCQIPGCKDPDGKIAFDLDNAFMYQSDRWLSMLEQTDKDRQEGAFAVAAPKYVRMIAMLRKAQGENSPFVALMLDHLAEAYLEGLDFERAYSTFVEAIAARSAIIKSLPPTPPEGTPDPNLQLRESSRLHMADMLTRLGQMDLAKGDPQQAHAHLAQAVSICNEKIARRFAGSLYAIYFDSLALESQAKWSDAEDLWKTAVAARDGIQLSTPYWDTLKEMAAFYARHGDFHSAAQIAQKVIDGTTGKQLRPALPMPYQIDSRSRAEAEAPLFIHYQEESQIALKEILALDKWQTDGPAAAAPLLPDLIGRNRYLLDAGSDAQRAQLLAWYEHRVFLHMSVLLDGSPSQDQINKAYALISEIKGRYLATIGDLTQQVEASRNNPGVDTNALPIIDDLAESREQQARIFLQSALDGKPFRSADFGAGENEQRILSSFLGADPANNDHASFFLNGVVNAVPGNAVMLDFLQWDRTDRAPGTAPHREYGVFVVRKDQPVRYLRLGTAEEIDKQIDGLKTGVLSGRTRGFLVEQPVQPIGPDALELRLKQIYTKLIAPVESDIEGAKQLLIVPDGKLALAPISAFENAKGHHLLENYSILYMNSWRDLGAGVDSRYDAATKPVFVANPDFNLTIAAAPADYISSKRPQFSPLPGAEMEARDIAQSLQVPPGRILIGKASRKWLIQSLTSPDILHFATHTVPSLEWTPPTTEYSLFDVPRRQTTQDPLLQSLIALAGANHPQGGPEDGILTGLEVSRLHLLGTRLVVLSTCQSGQGTPVEGLGVMGLRAAFMMAGAQSVVMTLWPVDDAAGRQFMTFFYTHLAEGPASALRLAQLDMIQKSQYKNPFYWSGYVVSGHTEIHQPSQKPVQTAWTPKGDETFITPRCFELTMKQPNGGDFIFSTFRLKLGGVVYRSQLSPDTEAYDLSNPGNTIVERNSEGTENGSRVPLETRGQGRDRWTGAILIKHDSGTGEMDLRFGRRIYDDSRRFQITLKGSSQVFPSFDIPETFPSMNSLTEATYEKTGKIDRIIACPAAPTW